MCGAAGHEMFGSCDKSEGSSHDVKASVPRRTIPVVTGVKEEMAMATTKPTCDQPPEFPQQQHHAQKNTSTHFNRQGQEFIGW